MSAAENSVHEANYDYVLKRALDEIISSEQGYSGLSTELQPSAPEIGRADIIVRDGLQPLIIFETKKDTQDVDSIAVHRKAREYALTIKSQYFVVSNISRTYLFKNDMGPLRELQIKLWEAASPLNIKVILSEILNAALNKTEKTSRKEIFLGQYNRILRDIITEYNKILHSNEVIAQLFKQNEVNGLLELAETQILSYMGVEIDLNSPSKREETLKNLATQASYLILNKIFCYCVISAQYKKQFGISLPNLFERTQKSSLKEQIDKAFHNLISNFDFAPIFQTDFFFSSLPFSQELEFHLLSFLEELSEFDLQNLEDNFIGEMYQSLIPLKKKKELGQIYTPNDIAKKMVQLAVRNPDSLVMDPACGCGTFLKELYTRLEFLNRKSSGKNFSHSALHLKLLEQIWGVEINVFPAHLSMMTLTFMNLSTFSDLVGILIHDFLDMGPLEKFNVKTKNLATGKETTREMPKKFDVIIANPPYVKQEKIPNKKKMMKLLPEYASYRSPLSKIESVSPISTKEDKRKKSKTISLIKLDLTGKTDYYGFFLWYSTFFLKEHGILCFIIPNKWMDVKYGEEIKAFLLNNYKILAIIGFDKNIFPDAQVSTVIIVIQKESNIEKRKSHIVRFLNISSEEGRENLESLVYSDIDSAAEKKVLLENYVFDNISKDIQRTFILQNNLNPIDKWSFKYLYQSEFERLLSKCDLIPLNNGEITHVIGGIKTGANDFFFPSEDVITKYQIEPAFLKPGIKSGRDIPIETLIENRNGTFLSIHAHTNLDNFPQLQSWIKDCEKDQQYHKRPSVKWAPWYAIPEKDQDCPDILFLRHIDSDFRAHANHVKNVVSDGVRGIRVLNPDHLLFYLGVLNSTFFYWQAHIRGRWEGQGDLQLLVYELNTFLIPKISEITPEKIKATEIALNALIEAEKKKMATEPYQMLSEHQKKNVLKWGIEERKALDLAVLSTMGLENAYDILISETIFFETLRLNKKF